jgi:uncharacterized protein (TIGR03000 family)
MVCQRLPAVARVLAAVVVGLGSSLTCWGQSAGGHGGGGGHTLGGYGWRGGCGYGLRGGYGFRYGGFYGYPGWYGLGWGFGLGYGLGCAYGYPYYAYAIGYPVYVTPGYAPPPAPNAPGWRVAGPGQPPGGPVGGAPIRLTDTDVLRNIRVPADAVVRINGEQTTQGGPRREFVSSGLAPGRTYTFVVTVRWAAPDGKSVEREERIHVQGGERRNVDFLTSSPPQDTPPIQRTGG